MRDYARIIPRFWIGKTGRALRGDPVAQSIALYLISGPHANMIGMYYLPIGYISGDTGIPYEGVAKALDKLLTLGFCTYDQDAELVWVHQMMSIQVGERLKNGDNNTIAVARLYESLPESRILSIFYDKYSDTHCLPFRRGLDSPLPRAFISQEQEQEQEQEQKQEQEQEQNQDQKKELSAPRSTERNAVPVDLFLTYPCNGPVKEYHLPMSQVNEWSMLYQGVDVASECKKALAWIQANNKKTAKGMPKFLVGWLSRSNDRGVKSSKPKSTRELSAMELAEQMMQSTIIEKVVG